MSILEQIFSEQFIYALGWTLLHSLWQGALIGLAAAGTMIFLHKYTARLRYFIYCISLFVVFAAAAVTFISSYNTFPAEASKAGTLSPSTGMAIGSHLNQVTRDVQDGSILPYSYISAIAEYCRTHIPLFVMIWMLGMLASLLRFMGGYALVRRYRYHRVKAVMGEWERRFRHLAGEVNVGKKVRLLESALVKVPMAIGYFKPVVLIPLGALNGVPAEQMEAIIVHELAHIKRRDYLVNLIQSILEVVFFYHPVVWWLSSNIRIERENICDDIAITITGNTMEFARALTNIQEMNLEAPGLAAGLSGSKKNRLVNRIRRLAGKPKMHSGFAEGFIAATILVISLIGLSAAAMITYPADKPVDPVTEINEASIGMPVFTNFTETLTLPDTTEKKAQKKEAESEKASYKVIEDGKSRELTEEEKKELQAAEEAIKAEMKAVEKQIKEEMQAAQEQLEEEMKAVHEQIQHQQQAQKEYQKAMEEYNKAVQEAMKESNFDQEEYQKEMQKAIQAYQKAMKDAQYHKQGSNYWTLPKLYQKEGYFFYDDDSLSWTHKYPGNFHFFGDSLKDIYQDQWADKLADVFELEAMLEDQWVEMEDDLMELQDFYFEMPEMPEMPELDYDFDYDHEYNFKYNNPDYSSTGKAKRIITDELREDDLIEFGREYVVVINEKEMLINGEKQSRAVFKKYRRLVDSLESSWLFADDEFKIFIGH